MCNLYSLISPQSEIGRAFSVEYDDTGNLPPLPGIFPNTTAPMIRMREFAEAPQMMQVLGIDQARCADGTAAPSNSTTTCRSFASSLTSTAPNLMAVSAMTMSRKFARRL
jgi:hypothetical protein